MFQGSQGLLNAFDTSFHSNWVGRNALFYTLLENLHVLRECLGKSLGIVRNKDDASSNFSDRGGAIG